MTLMIAILLFVLSVTSSVHFDSIQQSDSRQATVAPILPTPPKAVPPDVVPMAGQPMTEGEKVWWERVRVAGREAYFAWKERADALVKAARKVSQLPYGREPFDTILAKQDRESLNSRLLRAKTEIVAALAQGASKGYRPPLSDQMPLVLNRPMPFYTDTARKSHLQGDVRVRVDFGADGNLRILKVTRFLPDGLEDRAKEAVRDLLFLPAVQQGVFISYQQELTISFRLRD